MMGTEFVVNTLTGDREHDTALVQEAKAVIGAQESTRRRTALPVLAAKALVLVGTLKKCRRANRERLTKTPLNRYEEILKLNQEVREIDATIAALEKKYNLADTSKAAQAEELGGLAESVRSQAQALVFCLDRFSGQTANASLREGLGQLAGRVRLQFGVTGQAPYAPAPEVTGAVTNLQDQVRAFLIQLRDLLAKTTDPNLRETFGEVIDRYEREFKLKALTGDVRAYQI